MNSKNIIKTGSNEIVRIGNAIAITNKILALSNTELKVFYANDHEIMINAIQKMFEKKSNFRTAGRSYSFEETFEKIKDSNANILFTDDQMPKTDFVNDIFKIKKLYPELKIIVHSWGATLSILYKYIDCINGFIDIGAEEFHLHQIFDKVNNGENYFLKTLYPKDKTKDRSFFLTENRTEFLEVVKKDLDDL